MNCNSFILNLLFLIIPLSVLSQNKQKVVTDSIMPPKAMLKEKAEAVGSAPRSEMVRDEAVFHSSIGVESKPSVTFDEIPQEYKKAASALLKTMKVVDKQVDTFYNYVENQTSPLYAQNDKIDKLLREEFLNELDEKIDSAFYKIDIEAYYNNYTLAEINALNDWYKTDLGKKVMQSNSPIETYVAQNMTTFINTSEAEFVEKYERLLRESANNISVKKDAVKVIASPPKKAKNLKKKN